MKLSLGLLRRRECVVPTLRGWLAILLGLGGLGVGFLLGIYPFLAVNDPKPGGILVVEGWVSDGGMMKVIEEFHRGRYDGIYSTGGPVDAGSPLIIYKTIAEYGAAILVSLGCDPKVVHAVPTERMVKDRTYSSAVALKQWLKEHGIPVTTVNLYSAGAHSRRSRLLFQKAFGDEAQIGVVATEHTDFDPGRWWTSSAGFRCVTDEVIAYLYARFIFRPTSE